MDTKTTNLDKKNWKQVDAKTTFLGESDHNENLPGSRWTKKHFTWEQVDTKTFYLGAGGHKGNIPWSKWTQRKHTWEQVDTKLTAAS